MPNSIELRSTRVQEVMAKMPSWLIRWGISCIFVIFIIIIILAQVIHYPEIITARVTVTTKVPPLGVYARTNGALKLFVQNNHEVKKGERLGMIENTTKLEAIQVLTQDLKKLLKLLQGNQDSVLSFRLPTYQNLGKLQASYANLHESLHAYQQSYQNDYNSQRIQSLRKQISYYTNLNSQLEMQKVLLDKDLKIAELRYKVDKKLFQEGVLALYEFSKRESAYLKKTHAYVNADINISNNQIKIEEHQKLIIELQQQNQEGAESLKVKLYENCKNLLSDIAQWEDTFILKAPMNGKVSYFKYWSNQQFVNNKDEVLTVLPHAQKLLGRVRLSGLGIGKIKVGQQVNLKFDSYQFREFGIVKGYVKSYSEISRENNYVVEVELPQGLRTSYNKVLAFKQEMQGNAEIITEDMSLLSRVFYQFRFLFDKLGKQTSETPEITKATR